MENLLKFNFLKSSEHKKSEDTIIIKNTKNNTEESKEIENNFFISTDIVNEGSEFKSNNLLDESKNIIDTNKNPKPIAMEDNDLSLAENNIKISQFEINSGILNSNNKNNGIDTKIKFANKSKQQLFKKINNKDELTRFNNEEKLFNNKTTLNLSHDSEINNNKIYKNNDRYLNNFLTTITKKNRSRIKSFFQNYMNYTSKIYKKKNIKLSLVNKTNENIISSKSDLISDNYYSKEVRYAEAENKKVTNNANDSVNKEQNIINDSNFKEKASKIFAPLKETFLDNFDRLKNILDIKNHDIQQRFSQILENNIKLNNNRFEIQLRPDNLGKIQITLDIHGQNVDININSDNINAIQALTDNNSNLQKMLQNHGMNLNNFNFNGNNKNKGREAKSIEKNTKENLSIETENTSIQDNDKMSDKLVYVKA